MGTSSSNYGPGNSMPMLPDWSDDDLADKPNDQEEQPSSNGNDTNGQDAVTSTKPTSGNWSGAKRSLGSFARNPTQSNFRKAARSYVKASGGSRVLAKSAIHGKIVAGNFLSFFGGVRQEGFEATFDKLGIGEFSSQSVEQIFNKLAEKLSSGGGTDEETIARNAVIEALEKLYEDFDFENNQPDVLDSLTEDQSKLYIEYYIVSYIYERWLHELGLKIEDKDINPSAVVKAEKLAYDFIQSAIDLKFDKIDITKIDLTTNEGKLLIEEIFNQAYSILEAL